MEPTSPPATGRAGAKERIALQLPSSEDLVAFERSAAADYLARIEADAELVTQLMLSGYTGPGWDRFALALAEYGVQVIGAWVGGRERLIFAKCAAKGIGALLPVEYDADEASGLAHETVAKAIAAFRLKVLIPGRWKPAKGASLKTFFVGQCLFQFPNIYRKWQREQATARRARRTVARMDPDFLRPVTPVEVAAELRRSLARLAAEGPDSTEVLRVAHRFGYTLAEIAEVIGTTERAIEGRLYRKKTKPERADDER
jgi:DNA-directed RNA polymerase specialized sigma24 family protein